ncbi:MAG TPA: YhjD/YihY/BrkB family envelope integrity protein, partial [Roseomonas sp.]
LLVSALLSAFGGWITGFLPALEFLLKILNFAVGLAMVSLLFAAIYKILPDRQLAWRDVAVGAIITAFLFSIGKTAIGWYIGGSGMAEDYGAAGALIVVLIWVYYSAQVFLLGAEFTRAWAAREGAWKGRIPRKVAEPIGADAP